MYTGYRVFVKRDMYQFVYYKHVTNKNIYRHICHIIYIHSCMCPPGIPFVNFSASG